MSKQHVADRAFELHNKGYHCAEAVLLAVTEACNGQPEGPGARIATCFGGGVGRTHEELCGALAGGLIALGCLCGRDARGENWDQAAELAVALRQGFIARFGSSVCKDVLDRLGEQENMIKCKQLSGFTAGLAFALLCKAREQTCACTATTGNQH